MKERPILIITLGYIIGIIWGLYCKCNIAFLYSFIIVVQYLVKKTRDNKHDFKIVSISRYLKYLRLVINKNTIIILIIVSLISYIIVMALNQKYINLYRNVENINGTAIVISNAKIKDETRLYTIKVDNFNNNKQFKNTKLLLRVNKKINLEYGDKIQVIGEFQEPNVQRNYGGFDYKSYLKTKKIYGTIQAENVELIRKNSSNFIFTASNNIFLKIKGNIEKLYSEENSSLFLGIMLGYTDNINEEIKNNFKLSSISHILAVSGMHIMYVVLGISILLDNRIGKKRTKIITIIVLIIYMFVTNFSPSVVRAGIMGIVTLLASILHRKRDITTTISISMLIMLAYNPFLIYNSGFLLSYAGTLGIIVFSNNIFKILKKVRIKNKKIKYRINKKILKIDLKIKRVLSVTISAQLFLIPIIARLYNTVSISVLITNLFLSLVIGPIVILGFIQILISFISVNLASLLSILFVFLINILIQISKLGSILPLSQIYVVTPNIILVLIYYVIIFIANVIYKIYSLRQPNTFEQRIRNLISLFKYYTYINKKKVERIVSIIILGILMFFIVPKDLKVYFIDVGQGDSTLIKTPLNKTILIDGGGSLNNKFDVGESTLLPYLLDRKVKKIDVMIISHFDQDHVRAVCLLS